MGWWLQTKDGHSFAVEDEGLRWGDSVADILDKALDEIEQEFLREWDRLPTLEEIVSGVLFSTGHRKW